MKKELSAERLRELLNYDPETGVFTWRVGRQGTKGIGSIAGSIYNSGYLRIEINGRSYRCHRLAWFYVNSVWPSGDLDHINQIKSDNRIDNLREVNDSENCQNKLLQANNKSGYKGVNWDKNAMRWRAQIKVNNRTRHIGLFDTPEAAYEAYCSAAGKFHTHNPVAIIDRGQ